MKKQNQSTLVKRRLEAANIFPHCGNTGMDYTRRYQGVLLSENSADVLYPKNPVWPGISFFSLMLAIFGFSYVLEKVHHLS